MIPTNKTPIFRIKGMPETALIYLNDSNAEKLNAQLQQQHHISLKEFESGSSKSTTLNRYSRIDYLKLPKVDFYQLIFTRLF